MLLKYVETRIQKNISTKGSTIPTVSHVRINLYMVTKK